MARRRVGAAVGLALVSWVIVLIVCARVFSRVCACSRVCVRFSCCYMSACVRFLRASARNAQFVRFAAALISHSWG